MGTELIRQLLYGVAVGTVGASALPSAECGVLVTMWDQGHPWMERVRRGLVPRCSERAALPADPGPHAAGRRKWSGASALAAPPDRSGRVPGAPALWGQTPCLFSCPILSLQSHSHPHPVLALSLRLSGPPEVALGLFLLERNALQVNAPSFGVPDTKRLPRR